MQSIYVQGIIQLLFKIIYFSYSSDNQANQPGCFFYVIFLS
jgi:hypothetical protein